MRFFTTTILLFISVLSTRAEGNFLIKNFIIKENLLKGDKIAVIATDSLEQPQTSVNGTYHFNINAFSQDLVFNNGVAVCDMVIEKSCFLYLKHENEGGNVSNMYYVLKNSSGINPIKINWYILLIIPVGLILIGYLFRKFIGLVIFIFMAYIYFSYSKGLSFFTFLESVFDGLKNLF